MASYALLAAIPGIFLVAPIIGFLMGYLADGWLDTEPYLTMVGIILGFGAAARETYLIIKKYQALEEKKDKHNDGT
ncbi:MAG: AtpZ/AtpI family protein [candidate division Zixibacteria bacterium]|nr:AtpZ/AtpI family protein [candidate division Zixibacteria bacterium]MDD5426927.1 AtpZ/AtpI family protein [candidate division Zixibacteria bacterium]